MGFDWERYCLEWASWILAMGLIWPVLGIGIDLMIDGAERITGPDVDTW